MSRIVRGPAERFAKLCSGPRAEYTFGEQFGDEKAGRQHSTQRPEVQRKTNPALVGPCPRMGKRVYQWNRRLSRRTPLWRQALCASPARFMGKHVYPWNRRVAPRKALANRRLRQSSARLMGKRFRAVPPVSPCFITIGRVGRLPMVLPRRAGSYPSSSVVSGRLTG